MFVNNLVIYCYDDDDVVVAAAAAFVVNVIVEVFVKFMTNRYITLHYSNNKYCLLTIDLKFLMFTRLIYAIHSNIIFMNLFSIQIYFSCPLNFITLLQKNY